MKIQCAWCWISLGRKCHECSSTNLSLHGEDQALCLDCGARIVFAIETTSSTICKPCRATRPLENLPKPLTAEEIISRSEGK